MKGYPKTIAVVQDFINLLKMPEYKEQALKDLQAIYDLQDDKAIRATTLIDEMTLKRDIILRKLTIRILYGSRRDLRVEKQCWH